MWCSSLFGFPIFRRACEISWDTRACIQAFWLLCATLAVSIADKHVRNSSSDGVGLYGFVWFQAIVPFAHLELLIALALTKGSILFQTLTTRVAKFVGAISMTIYLVHVPVIYYVSFGLNNHFSPQIWPVSKALPVWGIPIVVAVTFVISIALFYGIEEPMRRCFKK